MTRAIPPANPRPLTWPVFITAAVALWLLGLWLGMSGGLWPQMPEGAQLPDEAPPLALHVLSRLGGVVYLLLDAAPVLLIIWGGAIGLGWPLRLLIEGRLPDIIRPQAALAEPHVDIGLTLQIGLGLGGLLLINYLIALAGYISIITAWGVPLLGVLLLAWQVKCACPGGVVPIDRFRPLPWTALLAAPILGVITVAATCPPATVWATEAFGYDVMSYHLQLPREWLAVGQLVGFEHNVYSYLPSLIESQYTAIAAMRGSVYNSIYTCQFFHATCAILAAAATTQLARQWLPRTVAVLAGVLLLMVPWVLILAASAYNEMGAIALAATALALLFHPAGNSLRAVAAAGALLGLATLAKLTAGPNYVIPALLIVLLRLNASERWPQRPTFPHALRAAAVLCIAGGLVLAPYFARNALDTGNPVFPTATGIFGTGHWSEAQAAAWDRAHDGRRVEPQALVELMRHWLLNTGYGAIGGRETIRTAENIAQFKYQFGVPTFWLLAAAGFVVLLLRKSPIASASASADDVAPPASAAAPPDGEGAPLASRRIAAAMGLMLAVQIVFWIVMTHQQSRFLVFSLVPGAVLAGSALAAVSLFDRRQGRGLALAVAAVFICVLMTWLTVRLFDRQTLPGAEPWLLVDSLVPEDRLDSARPGDVVGDQHPLNQLSFDDHVYIVADASRLLYIRRPMTYNSAFDRDALGDAYRAAGPNPPDVLAELRRRGVTHVWVHWGELQRLHNTYGYDPDVTPELISDLVDVGLRPVMKQGRAATLFEVPTWLPGEPPRLR